jgi:hypothetical protein
MRIPSGLALVLLASACAKSSQENSILQAEDLSAGPLPFDPSEIVDQGSFTDNATIDSATIASFLQQTPYKVGSFLETYESNGVRANDAMVAAGKRYGINPLVFLVRAQMEQGLVGEQSYPLPASRVEFVFGCGCAAPSDCDPALAGFDKQVGCLAQALKQSMDEITANGQTGGGWAPQKTSSTLDGVQVTPRDASTAALYQYTPRVAKNAGGGNWLFWNIWQNYATALGYSGPPGQPGPPGVDGGPIGP